ncbi:MFS transporter [Paraburkholderia unamae]|uniref:MFS transporter n=1 Tax=Paraburkholderia unamae TaxID=219649 RepID=A0ABX5KTI3_9BURK|nr:MFS transporter [Paraburkholderia unamae]PVX84404.1 MFS transporter [Paraburkholderia unamae]CAG9247931.1 MFS transporter [Paraburkholderia unamae]
MSSESSSVAEPLAHERFGHLIYTRQRRLYVLGILTVVYVFNFLDRQILTILAPYIKADLHIGDAQIGLLYGTCFALFYAVMGLPLARFADNWDRVRTLSLGLAVWSLMTGLSGLASGFAGLALARIGVGVGEASATPSAFSLLQDYFSDKRRATAIAVYSSGIFIGSGLAGAVAALTIGWWRGLQASGAAPLAFPAWKITFLSLGLPGIALALLLLFTVREPRRARTNGAARMVSFSSVMRAVGGDIASMTPPFSIAAAWRSARSRRGVLQNLLVLALCAAAAATLTAITDSLATVHRHAGFGHIGPITVTTNLIQWSALAFGVYAAWCWLHRLTQRDTLASQQILRSPVVRATVLAAALQNTVNYAVAGFTFLYGVGHFGLGSRDAFALGLIIALSGFLGTTLGGIGADFLARRSAAGRLWLAMAAALCSGALYALQLCAPDKTTFFAAFFGAQMTGTVWFGAASATVQGLVAPRLRGTAIAVQWLVVNLIGLGIGPYCVGLVGDVTGDLRIGMLGALVLIPASLVFYFKAARLLPDAERLFHSVAARSGDRSDQTA